LIRGKLVDSILLKWQSFNLCSLSFFQVTFFAKDIEFSEWKGDILAITVTEKDLSKDAYSKFENAVLKKLDGQLGGLLSEAGVEEDFTGKTGQSVVLRLAGQGFKRVGLIGLGQSASSTAAASRGLRESVASVAKAAQASSAAIVLASPSGIQEEFKLAALQSSSCFWYSILLHTLLFLLWCHGYEVQWMDAEISAGLNHRNRAGVVWGQQIQVWIEKGAPETCWYYWSGFWCEGGSET
jgi:hypothetical protein